MKADSVSLSSLTLILTYFTGLKMKVKRTGWKGKKEARGDEMLRRTLQDRETGNKGSSTCRFPCSSWMYITSCYFWKSACQTWAWPNQLCFPLPIKGFPMHLTTYRFRQDWKSSFFKHLDLAIQIVQLKDPWGASSSSSSSVSWNSLEDVLSPLKEKNGL